MATGLSPSIGATFLNALLNGATFTGTASLYGKLHIGDPGIAGTSNSATETTRKLVDFNSTFFVANPNINTVTWTAVAGSGLQTFTAMSFWSAATSGTFQFSIPFSGTVIAGNDFEVAPGGIVLNIVGIAA